MHKACTQWHAGVPSIWDVEYPLCHLEKSRGSPFLKFVAVHREAHHSCRKSLLRLPLVSNIVLASAPSLLKVFVLSTQLEQHRRNWVVMVVGVRPAHYARKMCKKPVCSLLRLPTLANSIFYFWKIVQPQPIRAIPLPSFRFLASVLCWLKQNQKRLQEFSKFFQEEGNFSTLLMLVTNWVHFGSELSMGSFRRMRNNMQRRLR